ncbi:gar1 [Symbiodinium sp. KB8]|nr:gar1 [Symbiodinium sp. KB8]
MLELGIQQVQVSCVSCLWLGACVCQVSIPTTTVGAPPQVSQHQGHLRAREEVELAISQTAQQLGGYADVLLLHTPGRPLGENATFPSCAAQGSWKECRLLAWRQLIRAQQDGLAKEIGVSNFDCSHLKEIEAAGLRMPLYNQIEVSAACPMNEELRFCQVAHGIHTLAYSPLGGAQAPVTLTRDRHHQHRELDV